MFITKSLAEFGRNLSVKLVKSVLVEIFFELTSIIGMFLIGIILASAFSLVQVSEEILILEFMLLIVSFLMKFYLKKQLVIMGQKNGVEFTKKLRLRLMEKLFTIGPQLYNEERTGQLLNMVWEKVEWLDCYFTYYLPEAISVLVLNIVVACILFHFQWYLGIVFIIPAMLVCFTPNFFHKKAVICGKAEWEVNSNYHSNCLDGIQGIGTLKSLNYTEEHQNQIEESSATLRKAVMNNISLTTFEINFMKTFIQLSKYSTLLLVVVLTIKKVFTKTEMLLLFCLIKATLDNSYKLIGSWLRGGKGISGIDEIVEFLNTTSALNSNQNIGEITEYKKNVLGAEFDGVCFSYSKDSDDVLKQIHLNIPLNQTTAIVGKSGSGKSTIAYLLSGFYEPKTGSINILDQNAHVLANINRADLVTAVWQDSRIFGVSCYQNIVMGKSEVGYKEVVEAAKKANIHEKIMSMPKGYDTIIGDGGQALSGGEKQRIVLARAILRNTPLLILDEATSYLDRKNEKEIQSCIKKLSENKAVLVIAHRLETIKNADTVYYLQDGKIASSGCHNRLEQSSKEYCSLFCL